LIPTEIIIHCSATRPEWLEGEPLSRAVKTIDSWHKAKGWKGIGYHYVVGRNGKVLPGRPESEQGAHVRGHNQNTLGICLLGGFGGSADDTFNDHYTKEQRFALENLIVDIQTRHDITILSGHNIYANKGCPCFDVSKEFSLGKITVPQVPSLFDSIIAFISKLFSKV